MVVEIKQRIAKIDSSFSPVLDLQLHSCKILFTKLQQMETQITRKLTGHTMIFIFVVISMF